MVCAIEVSTTVIYNSNEVGSRKCCTKMPVKTDHRIISSRNSGLKQEEGHGDLCSSDSLNYSRDGFYIHIQPRRLPEAASAVYHRLEPPWADSRFTLHAPIQHQHPRWYLRFILPAHSDFSCGDFAISLLQYLSEVGPWGSSHRPQRTSVRSKPSSPRHMPERCLFGPHPQQPVHRTHPTRPFDFGSLATT